MTVFRAAGRAQKITSKPDSCEIDLKIDRKNSIDLPMYEMI